MLGDGFQYCIFAFLEVPKFNQCWTLGPLFIAEILLKKQEESKLNIQNIDFVNLEIANLENGKYAYPYFDVLELNISKF